MSENIHIKDKYEDEFCYCGIKSRNFQSQREVKKNIRFGESSEDSFCQLCFIRWLQSDTIECREK